MFFAAVAVTSAYGQSAPREMRAATVRLTQWGYASGNIEKQKDAFKELTQKLDETGFNTLFVELQADGATGWKSTVQPSLICFTDKATGDMNYDPAKFVADCCHELNMDVYALVDPLHLGTPDVIEKYVDAKVRHPYYDKDGLCTAGEGSEIVMNPGIPATTDYLTNLYEEFVKNYDFDGIIFDNLQYPLNGIDDAESFRLYNPTAVTRDVWRRNNLTQLISTISQAVKKAAPYTRIVVTSEGTYQNRPGFYNPTAYGTYLQDAGLWMSSGFVDMVIPRMFHTEKEGFSRNLQFWIDSSAGRGVTVQLNTSALADYNGTKSSFISEMVGKVRDVSGVYGISFNSSEFIESYSTEPVIFKKALVDEIFKIPAHVGPLSFVNASRPGAPVNVIYDYDGFDYKLSWELPHELEAPLKYYSVYRLVNNELNPDNPLCNPVFKTSGTSVTVHGLSNTDRFFVTAFDRNGKESQLVEASGITEVENDDSQLRLTITGSGLAVESQEPMKSIELVGSDGIRYFQRDFNNRPVNSYTFAAPRKKVLIIRIITTEKKIITKKIIL